MNDPIIIPARDWVGSVPVGCPRMENEAEDGGPPEWVRMPVLSEGDIAVLYAEEAVDLSPPPLDADGYPERMDALPVARGRIEAMIAKAWPDRPLWAGRRLLGLVRPGPEVPFTNWNPTREEIAALFAYRGPNGERAWEVGRG